MLRENDFLRRTEGQLDDFIGRGMAVLENLTEQRGFLKVHYSIPLEVLRLGLFCWGLTWGLGCAEEGFGRGKYAGVEPGYDSIY